VDETRRELNFFAQLGEALGYLARFEMGTGWKGRRWDLSWVDPDLEEKQVVLCMERESDHHKADNAVERLLGPEGSKACYLVALLGGVTKDHFRKIKRRVEHPKGRSILLLAWVGEYEFHAIVAADGKLSTREGKAYVDEDKYWYARFLGGWQYASGYPRGRPRSPQTNAAK
jgi:hypothetical protein